MLFSVSCAVLGGNIAGLVRALSLARAGESVLLVEAGTCLFRDLHRAGDYALPHGMDSEWPLRLFPPLYRVSDTLAHPDRLKRHGEDLCREAGVQLLYTAHAVQWGDGQLTVACKSGLHAVTCERVYDCRALDGTCSQGARQYALHIMGAPGGDGHAVLHVPVPEDTPDDWYAVRELSLQAFAAQKSLPGYERITLARSGVCCTPLGGIDVQAAIDAGLAVQPSVPFHPDGDDLHADVVVVGGGTAGAVAAFSAARQGLSVLLLEMNAILGGTATAGGVSIYWFGTRDGATAIIDAEVDALYQSLGLPRKMCLWNEHDVFLPDIKALALAKLCREASVHVRHEALACGVLREGDAITGVTYARDGALCRAHAPVVIDATGDGDVAVLAGAAHSYGAGNGALTYWGSLAQYTAPDNYRNNFSTMVHVGDPLDYTRFIIQGRRLGSDLYDHGDYVALRESRHIRGMETVTLTDLLAMRPVADPLYVCFSNYDPKGKLTADIVYAGLLPPNLRMAVPRGAVIPVMPDGRPIPGLLVGGKAISATHNAFPGLRMQPDLQQQGFALGVLAALSVQQGVPAWEATGLQEAIAAAGGQRLTCPIVETPSLAEAVDALTGAETLEWLDMDPAIWVDAPDAATTCLLAPTAAILPLLRAAYQNEKSPSERRLLLSRLLLWHGCENGVRDITARIWAMLDAQPGLPPRVGPTTFGQLLPDHGLMPEAVYLLNTLAWEHKAPVADLFEEVLRLLPAGPRDWRDLRAGTYCYVECFAYVAARRGEAAFAPMLHALLALPELSGEGEADPLLAERFAMLRLALCEALARLDDSEGFSGLRALAAHPARAIAATAEATLAVLSGGSGIQRIRQRID